MSFHPLLLLPANCPVFSPSSPSAYQLCFLCLLFSYFILLLSSSSTKSYFSPLSFLVDANRSRPLTFSSAQCFVFLSSPRSPFFQSVFCRLFYFFSYSSVIPSSSIYHPGPKSFFSLHPPFEQLHSSHYMCSSAPANFVL